MRAPHRLMVSITRKLPAGAELRAHEAVPGRITGRERILPAAMHWKSASATALLAFADDMAPASFSALLQDTGASGGALVCPDGCSDEDAALALDGGFTIYSSYDDLKVTFPVLYHFLYIREIAPSFSGGGEFPFPGELSPYRFELFDGERQPLGMLRDVLWRRWSSGMLTTSPGDSRDLELLAGEVYTRIAGEFHPLRVKVDLSVEEAYYLAHLQSDDAVEFLDSAEAPEHVETEWRRLPNTSGLAVRPLLRTVNRLRTEQLAANSRVPYLPTNPEMVDAMLTLGCAGPDDVVFDLGCGDGRVVIAAAKKYGARGVGVDDDPVRIAEARANAEAAGVSERVEFRQQSIFDAKFEDATLVCLYLLPDVNRQLRASLQAQLAPGARVVSHSFDLGDWKPDEVYQANWKKRLYLWRIPGVETQM